MMLLLNGNQARALGYLPSTEPPGRWQVMWNRFRYRLGRRLRRPVRFKFVPERPKCGTDLYDGDSEFYVMSAEEGALIGRWITEAKQAGGRPPADISTTLRRFEPYLPTWRMSLGPPGRSS